MPKTREDFVPYELADIIDDEAEFENGGRLRTIEIDNNTVTIQSEDPYGFWRIKLKKGNLPDKLKGNYTSFDLALRDVNIWLQNKKEPLLSSLKDK